MLLPRTVPASHAVAVGGLLLLAAVVLYLYLLLDPLAEVVDGAAGEAIRMIAPSRIGRARAVAPFVEAHRGPVPFGLVMAIIEHESGFDPQIVNSRSGAAGLFQIMPQFRADYGVDAVSVFDAESNIRGGCAALQRHWSRIQTYIPGADSLVKGAAAYLGMAEGGGALLAGLKATQGTAPSWDAFCDAVRTARGKLYNSAAGMRYTGAQAPSWEARRAELLGGDGTAGAAEVVA